MCLLNEKSLEFIEKENSKLEKLKEQAIEKCALDNIIEKINNKEAAISIVEIPEKFLNTIQDYFLVTYPMHNHAIFITMHGDIKLCINLNSIKSPKYIEDYDLIDIGEINESLLAELYNYILTVNTSSQLEKFIKDE